MAADALHPIVARASIAVVLIVWSMTFPIFRKDFNDLNVKKL